MEAKKIVENIESKEQYLEVLARGAIQLYGLKPADTGKKYTHKVTVRGFTSLGKRVQVNCDLFLSEPKTGESKKPVETVDAAKVKGLEL